MTARYNVFKDPTTECPKPGAYDTFTGVAQSPSESALERLPGNSQWKDVNSVKNVPNVRRGHDIGNGD